MRVCTRAYAAGAGERSAMQDGLGRAQTVRQGVRGRAAPMGGREVGDGSDANVGVEYW